MVDFNRNVNPSRAGGEHIPAQPLWIFILRVIQGVFAILVVALAGNAASSFYLPGYGMSFFTFVWTLLFLLYIFLTAHFQPQFYHFAGHLAFEATLWIFWLVTFALLADYVNAWTGLRTDYWGSNPVDSTRAAMAFALLNWLLFSVTLGATIFLSRGATVDSSHATTTTGGGFGAKFSGLFSRSPRSDAEKGGVNGAGPGGPVTETGQPVELNDRPGGYGGYAEQGPPPPAAAPHYGDQPQRY